MAAVKARFKGDGVVGMASGWGGRPTFLRPRSAVGAVEALGSELESRGGGGLSSAAIAALGLMRDERGEEGEGNEETAADENQRWPSGTARTGRFSGIRRASRRNRA